MRNSVEEWAVLPVALVLATACVTVPHAEPSSRAEPPPPPPRWTLVGPTTKAPWEHARLDRADAPPLDLYLARADRPRPVLVLLQGSNCLPVFNERIRADGRHSEVSNVPAYGLAPELVATVNVVMVDRVGVQSFGPPMAPGDWPPRSHYTPACAERAFDKRLRVRDVADAVRAIAAQPWAGPIWLLGHSEGSDVATGVAAALGPLVVAAIGLVAGAGPTQFFDEVALARRRRDPQAAVAALEDALWYSAQPANAEGERHGEHVHRVITFARESTPLDDVREVRVPTFVASSTSDDHVPIASADLFVSELLRRNDRPVRYEIYQGLDHGMNCPDGNDRWRDIVTHFVTWAADPKHTSGVAMQPDCPPGAP
jgi:dienelactone hydrolase